MICKNCGKENENGHIMCPGCGALVEISSMSFSGINWGNEDKKSNVSPERVHQIPIVEPRKDNSVKNQIDSVKLDGDTTKEDAIKKNTTKNDTEQKDAAQRDSVQKLATVLNLVSKKKIADIQAAVKARNNGECEVSNKVERIADIQSEEDLKHQLFSMVGNQLSQEDLERQLHEDRESQLQEQLEQWRLKRELSQQKWREQQQRQARHREDEKRQALERIREERQEKTKVEQELSSAKPKGFISRLKTIIADKWNGLFYGMSEGQKIVRIIKFGLIIVMAILGYLAERDRQYHSYEQSHKRWEMIDKALEDYDPKESMPEYMRDLMDGKPPEGYTTYQEIFDGQKVEDLQSIQDIQIPVED